MFVKGQKWFCYRCFCMQNVASRDFYEPDPSLHKPDHNLYGPDRNSYKPDHNFYNQTVVFTNLTVIYTNWTVVFTNRISWYWNFYQVFFLHNRIFFYCKIIRFMPFSFQKQLISSWKTRSVWINLTIYFFYFFHFKPFQRIQYRINDKDKVMVFQLWHIAIAEYSGDAGQ